MAATLEVKVYELFLKDDTPAATPPQTLMNRFIKDITLTLNKSLSLSVNQSIDHIRKQYNLKKSNPIDKPPQKHPLKAKSSFFIFFLTFL